MTKKILVFDSGIGGLSIGIKILEQLPAIELDYAFDNQAFPYGDKENTWLLRRIVQFSKKAVALSQPDLLVVACNTATTLALDALRQELSIPIVGVVPAIKPATLISNSKEIILMATPNTLVSQYTKNLIDQFAKDAKVHLIGNRFLVAEAEKLMTNEKLNIEVISQVAKDIKNAQKADTIVLACTHYPFLKRALQANLDKDYNWVDSSQAIVKRCANLLDEKIDFNETFSENLDSLNNNFTNAKKILTSKKIENSNLKQKLENIGFKSFVNMKLDF